MAGPQFSKGDLIYYGGFFAGAIGTFFALEMLGIERGLMRTLGTFGGGIVGGILAGQLFARDRGGD